MRAKTNIRIIAKGEEYRYSGSNNVLFAGNFEHKGANATYVLYSLDSFDVEFVKNIKLKSGEVIFRVETERSKIAGIRPLIKVNVERGMVYFNEAPQESEDISFSTKGTPVRYLNLVHSV